MFTYCFLVAWMNQKNFQQRWSQQQKIEAWRRLEEILTEKKFEKKFEKINKTSINFNFNRHRLAASLSHSKSLINKSTIRHIDGLESQCEEAVYFRHIQILYLLLLLFYKSIFWWRRFYLVLCHNIATYWLNRTKEIFVSNFVWGQQRPPWSFFGFLNANCQLPSSLQAWITIVKVSAVRPISIGSI